MLMGSVEVRPCFIFVISCYAVVQLANISVPAYPEDTSGISSLPGNSIYAGARPRLGSRPRWFAVRKACCCCGHRDRRNRARGQAELDHSRIWDEFPGFF